MTIRRIEQLIDDENDRQITVLVNVDDERDVQIPQGVGVKEIEVSPGKRVKQPVQFPFDKDIKSVKEAWEKHLPNMTAYIVAMEAQYKAQSEAAAKSIVGPDGQPVVKPPEPMNFPPQ